MKKFFTIIPLQGKNKLEKLKYTACGNDKLNMDRLTSFPIMPVINATAQKDEKIKIIALKSKETEENSEKFETEVAELAKEIGFTYEIAYVDAGYDQYVKTQVENFQKLIDHTADDDELYGCITFGTKLQSLALKMAITYSNKIKNNTYIDTIVYGEIDWSNPENKCGKVYDVTALVQLDGIVDTLSKMNTQNPEEVIKSIISFD